MARIDVARLRPALDTRTSTCASALGGDDVRPRPAVHDADVDGRPDRVVVERVQRAAIWCASSWVALMPFCGSTPACAARPSIAHQVIAGAFARGLERAARQRRFEHVGDAPLRAPCPRSAAREVGLPTSSSDVNSTRRPRRSCVPTRAQRRKREHSTMPAFMSKQPGPRATPVGIDAERDALERARRPDRVVVAQRHRVRATSLGAVHAQQQVGAAVRPARGSIGPNSREQRRSASAAKRSRPGRSSLGDSMLDELVRAASIISCAARLEVRAHAAPADAVTRASPRARLRASAARRVRALMRSRLASKPRPGRSHGTSIAPRWARIGGSTMSSR